jgi:hypothetical protein
MYRYGLLVKDWYRRRKKLAADFVKTLGEEEPLFEEFFATAQGPYGDQLDQLLKMMLTE